MAHRRASEQRDMAADLDCGREFQRWPELSHTSTTPTAPQIPFPEPSPTMASSQPPEHDASNLLPDTCDIRLPAFPTGQLATMEDDAVRHPPNDATESGSPARDAESAADGTLRDGGGVHDASSPSNDSPDGPSDAVTNDVLPDEEVVDPLELLRTSGLENAWKTRCATQKDRDINKGKKPGNPGKFAARYPEAEKLLEEYKDQYNAIPKEKGAVGKNKKLSEFWDMVWARFWKEFQWETFAEICKGKDQTSVVAEVEDVSTIAMCEYYDSPYSQSIKRWYHWRNGNAVTGQRNIWTNKLAALRKPDGPAPKRKPDWMVYSSDRASAITEIVGSNASIHVRNQKARELFAEETEEVQQEYTEKAERDFQERKAVYEAASSGEPPENDDEKAQ